MPTCYLIALLGFQDESALLKHELAYCLGQMKHKSALSVLESVLNNKAEDPMVRHEVSYDLAFISLCVIPILFARQAAEAIGAISSESSLPVLQKYLNDPERTVRETCEIAIDKIKWDNSEEGQRHHSSLSDANSIS